MHTPCCRFLNCGPQAAWRATPCSALAQVTAVVRGQATYSCALQAGTQTHENGHAAAANGKDNRVAGADRLGVEVNAVSNAHLTAELAAATPYEVPGKAAGRPFFDPAFSPVAESFDVNPEANDGLRKLPLDRYTAQSGLGLPYPTAELGPPRPRCHDARVATLRAMNALDQPPQMNIGAPVRHANWSRVLCCDV